MRLCGVASCLLAPICLAGQGLPVAAKAGQGGNITPKSWVPPRTADGQPDLRGRVDQPHSDAVGTARRIRGQSSF